MSSNGEKDPPPPKPPVKTQSSREGVEKHQHTTFAKRSTNRNVSPKGSDTKSSGATKHTTSVVQDKTKGPKSRK